MKRFGDRLRERAKELGLSDSEVARRVGLSQSRYSHYVNGLHEPDLGTLARIVSALGITADQALGLDALKSRDEAEALRARIALAAGKMDAFTLRAVAGMVEAIASAASPAFADGSSTKASSSKPRKRVAKS